VVPGEAYAGVLERDGWAPDRQFTMASHQTYLAHLLRRCRKLLDDAERGQAKPPMQSAASSKRPWRPGMTTIPTGWVPPRLRPTQSGWARRSTGSSPGGPSMRPTGGCWTT
jgi:hypothetical protein